MMLIIISILLAIIAFLLFILIRYKHKMSEMQYPYEMEERLLELLGKFKHVATIKLDMLEKKIEDLKKLIREANDVYASLVVLITDASKLKDEIVNVANEKNEDNVKSEGNVEKMEKMESTTNETEKTEQSEEIKVNEEKEDSYEETVEKKIMRLNEEGMSDTEIARELGIGVSEVKLVIDLFKRRGG